MDAPAASAWRNEMSYTPEPWPATHAQTEPATGVVMTPVERALSASRRPMTLREIGLQTGLDHDEITAQLRALSAAENREFIPARGHHAKSYTLKSTPAGAMPDAQPAEASIPGSDGSGFLISPE